MQAPTNILMGLTTTEVQERFAEIRAQRGSSTPV